MPSEVIAEAFDTLFFKNKNNYHHNCSELRNWKKILSHWQKQDKYSFITPETTCMAVNIKKHILSEKCGKLQTNERAWVNQGRMPQWWHQKCRTRENVEIHAAAIYWLETQQPPNLYCLDPFEFYPTQALTWFVELSSCFQIHIFVFFRYHLLTFVWVLYFRK